MEFKFTVQLKIQKPVSEVFDAVYDPKKLARYFVSHADAPLDEGKTVMWTHASESGEKHSHPVKVQKTVHGALIRFAWPASEGVFDPKTGQFPRPADYENLVEMTFEALKPNETLVKIVEGTWRTNDGGLQSSYQNCQGWMNMLCCMKAFLEYDINLRKGSF